MKKYWLRAKSYGYGSGPPISWEGWAVLAAYVIAVLGVRLLAALVFRKIPSANALSIVAVIILTGLLVWICHDRTEGGWRWRWGEDA